MFMSVTANRHNGIIDKHVRTCIQNIWLFKPTGEGVYQEVIFTLCPRSGDGFTDLAFGCVAAV